MHTLVIGGSGFLGYHIVNELLSQGQQVTVLCRNTDKAKQLFADRVNLVQGDIYQLSMPQMEQILKPCQGLVFAAGVDERAKPEGDTRQYFYQGNVVPCEKLFYVARHCNIDHAVLLNSIFAYMDRAYPEMELANRHPYVYSRVEQSRMALQMADGIYTMTVLEVPWVFGPSHGANNLWGNLINYVRTAPLLVTPGGANMISTDSVAQAVVGGLLYPQQSEALPIGDTNMNWVNLLEIICDCVGRKDKTINTITERAFRDMTKTGGTLKDLLNIGSGMDTTYLPDIILNETYYDAKKSQQILKYRTGDIMLAIQSAVDATPENTLVKGWRKGLNLLSSLQAAAESIPGKH